MLTLAQQLYRDCDAVHSSVISNLGDLKSQLAAIPVGQLGQLADASYALREMDALLDAAGVAIRAAKEIVDKAACGLYVQQTSNDPRPEPIRTTYCTATPDIARMVKIPSRRTAFAEYKQFCLAIGVPEHLIGGEDKEESGAVALNWKGVVRYISELLASGRDLPSCLTSRETFPVYSLRVIKRKGVLEDND